MNRFICDALAPSYRVYAAFDGRRGFEVARAVKPDLIVCDFMMPEMSGDELVRAVRSHPRINTVPILILTARNDTAARIGVLREGANDYLLKPFFQPELRARVDNLVKVKQSEEHLRALDMANERDRIARDLHDLVIQRVFGAGMRLNSLYDSVPDEAADRLRDIVAELDSVISDIRTTIFDLQAHEVVAHGARAGVLQLTGDAADRLGFEPRLRHLAASCCSRRGRRSGLDAELGADAQPRACGGDGPPPHRRDEPVAPRDVVALRAHERGRQHCGGLRRGHPDAAHPRLLVALCRRPG